MSEDAIQVLKSDYDLLRAELNRLNDVRMSEKSVWILRQKMSGRLHTYTSVDGQPSAAYVQYVPATDIEKLESELNYFKGCTRSQAFKIAALEEQLKETKC